MRPRTKATLRRILTALHWAGRVGGIGATVAAVAYVWALSHRPAFAEAYASLCPACVLLSAISVVAYGFIEAPLKKATKEDAA